VIDILKEKPTVVWSIAGSDSGGGTGIQADLHTFHDFKVHGCTVITALTAQNSFAQGYTVATERKNVVAQINALDSDMPADAIKVGMLPNLEIVETVVKYLQDYEGFVVYDLELESSGEALLGEAGDLLRSELLPRVNLLVINVDETEALLNTSIEGPEAIVAAASALMAAGSPSVLITGAQFASVPGQRFDYWASAEDALWISIDELSTVHNQGGGCALSAAITAAIGRGLEMEQALKLAKAYVTQGIRGACQVGSGPGAVAHLGWPDDSDMPQLSRELPVV
jgi:hydroxymethylpyrimidine kinase/phosphomethylpyrimidine kinase/thiamine-phosphate diphosphorylase